MTEKACASSDVEKNLKCQMIALRKRKKVLLICQMTKPIDHGNLTEKNHEALEMSPQISKVPYTLKSIFFYQIAILQDFL